MRLEQWLKLKRGRGVALATRLGVSKARVTQMARDGVPRDHMVAVRDFTAHEVTLEDMLSDCVERGALQRVAA